MKVYRLRTSIQIVFFLLLIYGGYIGLRVKNFLPVWSCPNSNKYSEGCYLLPLQRSQYGVKTNVQYSRGITLSGYFIMMKWEGYLFLSLWFIIIAVILNRFWCGWICPFGTFQDWFTTLRRNLSSRETRLSQKAKDNLKMLSYILVLAFLIFPLLMPFGLRAEFEPLFCHVCPVKAIMPIFGGNFLNLAIHSTHDAPIQYNLIFFVVSSTITIIITGIIIVGIFFQERLFCFLCPVGTLIGLFHKISLLGLKKNVTYCNGCGKCWQVCPMDIKEVYLAKEKRDVFMKECILCLKCIESCPQDKTLNVEYFKNILSSRKK